ncbi:MAG TPA: ferrochelatase [Caulobacteraceae bacterium]|jgi:ferrochelatase
MGRGDRRVAVVLFNLGGPRDLDDVQPFLKNLFSDPAIIDLPGVLRRPLSDFIAYSRARTARANYQAMGGGSPLLAETQAQADALGVELAKRGLDARLFIAMRYWSPTIDAMAAEVARFAPTDIVLTPLYPQFSITTTESSLKAWRARYTGPGEVHAICCWPQNEGLITAHAEAIGEVWRSAGEPPVKLLFSAHGIPIRTAKRGDPYAWQVESTCRAIAGRLGTSWDWQVCYQSRVGPLQWLGPSTPEAIRQAARDGMGVLVDPVSFVSEHVETLIELDRDYAALAREAGAPCYLRAPTVGVRPRFIEGLATAILERLERAGVGPDGIACPAGYARCAREGKDAA